MKPFRNFFKKFKKKKPVVAIASEKKSVESERKLNDLWVHRRNAHKHEMVTELVGKGFVQKNEKLMVLRKNIAKEMNLNPKKIEVLDKLFRLRKAGQLASRGVVSETAAKEMIKFLQERKADLKSHGESKEHLEVFNFAIDALNSAIKRGPIDMKNLHEIRQGQIEVGANSHYVFDLQGKTKIKPLEVNLVATRLVSGVAQDLIELSLGDKYQKFVLREKNARKKI